ncbi:MAG: antibiotic biosynthesis monooxygenase, partial [Janthinobacterium lividum]
WTRSDAFRAAHRSAGGTREMYLGPPEFEGFESVQRLAMD